jgi:hypothetical protein
MQVTFCDVTVPYVDNAADLEKIKALYPLQIYYQTEQDVSCDLYVNGEPVDTLKFEKGEDTCVSKPVYIDPSKFNRIELCRETESLACLQNLRLYFGEAVIACTYIEAEEGELSGSAYSNGSYVAGIDAVGSSLYYPSVRLPADGLYTIRVYHTAAAGKATHTVIIDDTHTGTLHYEATPKWGIFSDAHYGEYVVWLSEGAHRVKILKNDSDQNFAEIDRIEFILQRDS